MCDICSRDEKRDQLKIALLISLPPTTHTHTQNKEKEKEKNSHASMVFLTQDRVSTKLVREKVVLFCASVTNNV
jgi:hypothetical protein